MLTRFLASCRDEFEDKKDDNRRGGGESWPVNKQGSKKRRLLLFDRWDKKGFSRSSDRGCSNLLPPLEEEGPPFRSTFPFSRLIPSSRRETSRRSAVDSNVGTSSSLSSSIFDTNEYQYGVATRRKRNRKKRSIRYFCSLYSLFFFPPSVKNRRTVENVSQPIFPANYWRGGGRAETKRGRNNGKQRERAAFPADKRNDRCRAVIGKQ